MQTDDELERGAGTRGYAMQSQHTPDLASDENTREMDASKDPEQDSLAHDNQSKTAYYNSAAEKSLSHAEAKLFFQRHQLETFQQDEAHSPLARAKTVSSAFDGDGGLSRTTSIASRGSGRGPAQRDNSWRTGASLQDRVLEAPILSDTNAQGAEDEGFIDIDGDDGAGQENGLGGTMGDPPSPVSDISPELSTISINIKRVLDIRHKYIDLSMQGPNDNPKDGPNWRIYPPPPNPIWDANKMRPTGQTSDSNSLNDISVLPGDSTHLQDKRASSTSLSGEPAQQPPALPTAKRRKPGQDIGEDFDMSDLLPLPVKDGEISFELDQESVYQIYDSSKPAQIPNPLIKVPTLREFYRDMDKVQNVSSDGPTKSFAFRQLDILEGRFHLYFLVNSYQETADCKRVPHRDFYNVRKVDTHVHHSACMNQKHLLRFIKSKMKKFPDEVVMFRDNKRMTLKEVFQSIKLTAYDLSIDTLDMHVSWLHYGAK